MKSTEGLYVIVWVREWLAPRAFGAGRPTDVDVCCRRNDQRQIKLRFTLFCITDCEGQAYGAGASGR